MNKRLWILLSGIVLGRLIIAFFLQTHPTFFLGIRNFNGRGLLIQPTYLDFVLPLLLLIFLLPGRFNTTPRSHKRLQPIFAALLFVLAPVLTGFFLFGFINSWYVRFQMDRVTIARYVLFLLSFLGFQLFADALSVNKKFVRRFVLLILLLFLAGTQEFFSPTGDESFALIIALFSSVGLTTALLSLALRRYSFEQPADTLIAGAIAGALVIFPVINVVSTSYFTIFLPALAMLLATFALRSRRSLFFRTAMFGIVPFIALLLSVLPPFILPQEQVTQFMGKNPHQPLTTEQVGSMTIRYGDPRVREITRKLARVIEQANTVCRETLGISPEVNELIIYGIAPGGFHGEFPHRIVGNIISEKYLQACNDSLFLNDSTLSPNFPDPVNGILHEYSHLFGFVPYLPWIFGAEEEGWATFSATVLSRLMYQKFGSAWQPAYNHARQADKIEQLNLSGKAVVWSHYYEYGGFQLWYRLTQEMGIGELFRRRWEYTRRDLPGMAFLENNPDAARNLAEAFGREKFIRYGTFPSRKFGEIYTEEDWLSLARLSGMPEERIKRLYRLKANQMVKASITLP